MDVMLQVKIAFIGFGEVGYNISKGLREDFGQSVGISAYDVAVGSGKQYEKTLLDRMSEQCVTLSDDPKCAVADAEIVFSAVQAVYALDVGKNARDFMKADALYIDLTTSNPKNKLALESFFAEKDMLFVDSAMMGPLPVYKHKVPMLISGSGAQTAGKFLKNLHMEAKLVEGPAGTASKIKLVRSVFMKGLQALLVETFLFARKEGIENVILNSISETMDKCDFRSTAARLITADPIHSERRAHEISDSINVMKDSGIRPIVSSAIESRLSESAALGLREELKAKVPDDMWEVFELWDKKSYS
jgi:3-hydroxyisobutyrate dehydrogenase-like beta-hydroxyacid dehydrogenase